MIEKSWGFSDKCTFLQSTDTLTSEANSCLVTRTVSNSHQASIKPFWRPLARPDTCTILHSIILKKIDKRSIQKGNSFCIAQSRAQTVLFLCRISSHFFPSPAKSESDTFSRRKKSQLRCLCLPPVISFLTVKESDEKCDKV